MMTFYQREVERIRNIIYANREQLDIVIRTRKYIDENFGDDINLEVLCRTQFVSKYHLLRLFKKYYGLTPKKYLTEKRIEESRLLLLKGISVKETCFAVGYTSPSSFSTWFKSKTGLSPMAFQNEQLSRSD